MPTNNKLPVGYTKSFKETRSLKYSRCVLRGL
jgi:hypothetical protein